MKIETKSEAFKPVVITLETQEEVDQLYAVMTFTPVNNALGTESTIRKLYKGLNDTCSRSYEPFHKEVVSAVVAWVKEHRP